MRLPSVIAHLVGVVLMLLLLRRLRRLRVLDQWGYWAGIALAVTNFSTFALARWGRPEPFTADFALIGFLILYGGSMKAPALRRRALIAGLFIGLSAATHTVAAFYCGLFAIALWGLRKRIGLVRSVIALCIPPLTFAAFWIAMFGSRSLDALRAHFEIARAEGGTRHSIWRVFEELLNANPRGFYLAGGTTTLFLGAVAILLLVQMATPQSRQSLGRKGWLLLLAFGGMGFMVVSITGLAITRAYVYFPFAVAATAILISRWEWRRAAFAAVLAISVGEMAEIVYYTATMTPDFAERSPSRLDPVMKELAGRHCVATTPHLWLDARRAGMEVRLVDTTIAIMREYWERGAGLFDGCDAAVFPITHPLDAHVDLKNWKRVQIPQLGGDLIVYLR
jgi:hypothetical protein